YGAFAEALVHWEASRVGATVATTPLFTFALVALGSMLWPTVIKPELLNSLAYLGALLVVSGSALIALAPSLLHQWKARRLRRGLSQDQAPGPRACPPGVPPGRRLHRPDSPAPGRPRAASCPRRRLSWQSRPPCRNR